MDQLFEAFGNGLGGTVTWMADVGLLFAIFAVLWIVFGAAIVWLLVVKGSASARCGISMKGVDIVVEAVVENEKITKSVAGPG